MLRPSPRSVRGVLLLGAMLATRFAVAQTEAELDQARAVFNEALADQKRGDDATALEKFRRVAKVRDTVQVEFRIATCFEALGRARSALQAYALAAKLGLGDPHVQDVVEAANARAAKLASEMGTLDLTVQGANAEGADVRIDDEPVAPEERRTPLLLEPGSHRVDVRAERAKVVHGAVAIVRGGRATLTIVLEPADIEVEPRESLEAPSTTRRDAGFVVASLGAASAIGAAVSLFVRHGDISTIESDCPGGVCNVSQRDEIEGLRRSASTLTVVAGVLASVGAVGIGTGVVLIALGPQSAAPRAWIAPTGPGVAGISLGAAF